MPHTPPSEPTLTSPGEPTGPVAPRARWRGLVQAWWPHALIVVAVALGLVSTLKRYHGDLPVYLRGAARMSAGEEVYVIEQSGFTYPPLMAVPFTPLVDLPEKAQRATWYGLNVLMLFGVVVLVNGLVRARVPQTKRRVFWLLVFAIVGRHVTSAFENQSNDLLILFVVTASVAAAARAWDAVAGTLIGLGAALKATPLLFLPVFVWQRRWAATLALVVSLALFCLLPDVLFPRADGGRWIVVWYETFASKTGVGAPAEAEGGWVAWNALNQSLSGTLFRLSDTGHGRDTTWDVSLWQPSATQLRALILSAQVGVLALIALGTRRPRRATLDSVPNREALGYQRLGEAALVVCGMVLLSPMSSKAHFGVLLLPVAHQLASLYRRRDPLVIACLVGVFALGTLTSKGLLGVPLGNEFLARGSVTWCALLAMLGSLRVIQQVRRRSPEPAGEITPEPVP